MFAKIVIQGEPVPKKRPRVALFDRNGRQLARPRTYTPAASVAAEELIKLAIRSQMPGHTPTSADVSVKLLFWQGSRRHTDVDNFAKQVLDACNNELWVDDSQVRHLDAAIVERGSSRPGTIIFVQDFDGEIRNARANNTGIC